METIVATQSEAEAPVPALTKSTEVLPKIPEAVPSPPSLRIAAGQLPLAVDILGAKPYYDTFDVKPLCAKLDSYVNAEIARQALADTESAYKSVVAEVIKKLHLPPETTPWAKLEKLVEYFRINQKLADALKERERLLTADPLTLTATQMKHQWELTHG